MYLTHLALLQIDNLLPRLFNSFGVGYLDKSLRKHSKRFVGSPLSLRYLVLVSKQQFSVCRCSDSELDSIGVNESQHYDRRKKAPLEGTAAFP